MSKKSIFAIITILFLNVFTFVNAKETGVIEIDDALSHEFMSTKNLNNAGTKKKLIDCMVRSETFSDKVIKKISKSKYLTFYADSPISYVAALETVVCRVKICTKHDCYFATIKEHQKFDGTLRIAAQLPCSRKRKVHRSNLSDND